MNVKYILLLYAFYIYCIIMNVKYILLLYAFYIYYIIMNVKYNVRITSMVMRFEIKYR